MIAQYGEPHSRLDASRLHKQCTQVCILENGLIYMLKRVLKVLADGGVWTPRSHILVAEQQQLLVNEEMLICWPCIKLHPFLQQITFDLIGKLCRLCSGS
jgi:hypothetical protein